MCIVFFLKKIFLLPKATFLDLEAFRLVARVISAAGVISETSSRRTVWGRLAPEWGGGVGRGFDVHRPAGSRWAGAWLCPHECCVRHAGLFS